MPAAHVFVDETKEAGLLLTAAAVLPGSLQEARRVMRSQILPRQRRIHFITESAGRRKQIIDAISELAPACTLYDGSKHHPRRQRAACLRELVRDLAASRAQMLVLERDDSILRLDRQLLYQQVREHDCVELEYRHLRAHEEPLLAIPDAIAWCWQRGGPWRDRVRELVTEVRVV